jgi:seryl-tRNA synthetase
MIDIQLIRDNPSNVAEKSKQKGYEIDTQQILGFDGERRELAEKVDELRRKRNELASQAKGQKPSEDQLEEGRKVKEALLDAEHKLDAVNESLNKLLKKVPNLPLDDVPIGSSEDENVISKTVGEVPHFDFQVKNHAEIAEANDWLDKKRAAKVAGSRFAYLKGSLVKLQFALIQYVITTLTDESIIKKLVEDNGLNVPSIPFVPVLPPALIKTAIYEDSGRLDAEEVTYKIEQDDLWLNASAEHSLCTMYADEILNQADLPIRYIGYSTSFRREAGSYGKDMEGMFRMHQFDKLEMEVFSTPESGKDEHLLLVAVQEYLMQQLGLPYQVINKCTADIGFPNARGVDINTWLPGQGKYRETQTADYLTDFQTRRLKTRVKTTEGKIVLAHTNDATAIALSRVPIAIIENYQTKEGKVKVPSVLQPYLGGQQEL